MGHLGHLLAVDPIDPYMPGALGHLGHRLTVDPIDPFDVVAWLGGAAGYGSFRPFRPSPEISRL